MTQPIYDGGNRGGVGPEDRGTVNYMRLWAGGIGTAIVAALIVVVGVLLVRGVFRVNVMAPRSVGAYGNGDTTTWAILAAGAALLATMLLNLLMVGMPRPTTFFTWIVGLATAAAALVPFTVTNDLETSVPTGAINLVTGLAIISLLTSVGSASVTHRTRPVSRPAPPYYGDDYR